MTPRSKPSRHNTAGTARPNHNVFPGRGQGGAQWACWASGPVGLVSLAHQVPGVGRYPGECPGYVDHEVRKDIGGQEQEQEGKQELAHRPTC